MPTATIFLLEMRDKDQNERSESYSKKQEKDFSAYINLLEEDPVKAIYDAADAYLFNSPPPHPKPKDSPQIP